MLLAVSDGVWIAGLGGFFTLMAAIVAAVAHVYTSRAMADAERNTAIVQASQTKVDEWDKLLKAKNEEIDRLSARLSEAEAGVN
jgi:alpha/beta superfamily hydrolase